MLVHACMLSPANTTIHNWNLMLLPAARRKSLPLPVFGGLTRPVLAAEWELGSNWRKVPRLQLGLAVADDGQSCVDDGATLSNDGAVAFRKKMFVTRRWGLEVSAPAFGAHRVRHRDAGQLLGSAAAVELAGCRSEVPLAHWVTSAGSCSCYMQLPRGPSSITDKSLSPHRRRHNHISLHTADGCRTVCMHELRSVHG
jgi:hypothetical protein